MLKIKREKTFLKDLRKAKMTDKQYGKFILYISKLINKEALPKESKDHSLTGEWKDVREFHIGGDLVVLFDFLLSLKEEDSHKTGLSCLQES